MVDGAKQWSRGVKVLYGESAEKQERVADELGMDVDVRRRIALGKTVCLSGGVGEPRRV